MNTQEIERRVIEIIERAEYTGRQRGIAKATRSSKASKAATEMADISERYSDRLARDLIADLTADDREWCLFCGSDTCVHAAKHNAAVAS